MIDYSLQNQGLPLENIKFMKLLYSIFQPICGAIGVLLSNALSSYFKSKSKSGDCFVFSLGFFANSLFLCLYLVFIDVNEYLALLLCMISVVSFNVCWVIKAKILIAVVHPSLRSTANSLRLFALHLIGDDASPYWTGQIADFCLDEFQDPNTVFGLFYCTELSLYPLVFVSFLAAAFALFMSLTFERDETSSQYLNID